MRERIELQKEQNRVFFDRATWFYETWLVKKINRIFQRRLLKEIQIKKNSKILDAGCGTGTFLETLDKNCENVKLEGIDISVKMVEVSRKRLGKKVCLSVESVENIKFREQFDYIFSIDSFHHYADHNKAMENFYKALKKGGKLVILDFSFGQLGNWVFRRFEPGRSRMYLRQEFRKLFERHEFKEIRQKRLGWFSILTVGTK